MQPRLYRHCRLIITTTPTVETHQIEEYLGLVTGAAILGANVFKDFFAGITDVIGGRSANYERELLKAKNLAIEEMTSEASLLGADAVVGVDLDYETIGANGSMLMVTASGTAVRLGPSSSVSR
jgi:uncharacterized protein YbjQ (UPF0145 family)